VKSGGWQPELRNARAALLLLPLVVVLLAFVVYPLVKLTIDSLTTGDGLGNYADVLRSAAGRRALITTLLASLLVTVLATAIGGMIAWYLRTAKRAWVRGLLWLAILVPFWMGTVVKNYAIVVLLSANGPLNKALDALHLGHTSLLYTTTAVVIGMTYTMVPYAAFSLSGVFARVDESLIAAARSMGAPRVRAMRDIVIPLTLPGIAASAALVFAISLGFYVTPVLLGGAQAPFMASLIQDYIFNFFEYPLASAGSVMLLLVALATLGVALRVLGRERLMRAMA
jgi:putative spermidine/putrescine transport system permease protein